MSTYTIDQAKELLVELIDRALGGEDVVITRDAGPVVLLTAVAVLPAKETIGPITQSDLDWIRARRVPRLKQSIDSVTLVRQMRDED